MDTQLHRRFLAQIGDSIVELIFPAWCLSCQEPGSWWCRACQQRAVRLPLGWCGSCGRHALSTTLCPNESAQLGLTRLVSGFAYAGTVQTIIQTIKYRPAEIGLTALLADDWLVSRLMAALPADGLIVPIPLSVGHERQRGFNQAEHLARRLVLRSQWDRISCRLVRISRRPAQVGSARAERLKNMVNTLRWTGISLVGQTVSLIDDVVTTGATLAEAARVLRAAGARRVIAVTLAQAPAS